MIATANAVLAAIDARRPGMKLAKKLSLLFFAQGHHLGWRGRALFDEPIVATDRGVTVNGADGTATAQPDGEGPLNTIGYVVERYASLSPADLRTLVQSSAPWQQAVGGVVDLESLRDWFRRDDETDDPDDERLNRAERAEAAKIWAAHKAAQS